MRFRVTGLDPAPFVELWEGDDAALRAAGAVRMTADSHPGFPDRIGLDDAPLGEDVILVNHISQSADTPYRASHAIFVWEGAARFDEVDVLPPAMLRRPQSLRAFDRRGMMRAADIADGAAIADLIGRLFDVPEGAEIHAHNARQGCYMARISRA